MSPMWNITTGLFGLIRLQFFWHYLLEFFNYNMIQPTISLEMPVPSQGHYGFHSFPVVDWFCLFMTFPLEYCSEFGNFVITLMTVGFWLLCLTATFNNISVYRGGQFYWWRNRKKPPSCNKRCSRANKFSLGDAVRRSKKKYDLTKYHILVKIKQRRYKMSKQIS